MYLRYLKLILLFCLFTVSSHASDWKKIEYSDSQNIQVYSNNKTLKFSKGSSELVVNLEKQISGISHYEYSILKSLSYNDSQYFLIKSESSYRGYVARGECAMGVEEELLIININNSFTDSSIKPLTLNSCNEGKRAVIDGSYSENEKIYFLVMYPSPGRTTEYSVDLKAIWKDFSKKILEEDETPNRKYFQ